MNNQHDAIVTFTEDGEGGVKAEAGTVIEFNEALLTHRMVDAVQEMHAEIGAKARGEFTDGERYRALRAGIILDAQESPLMDRLNVRVEELSGTAEIEPKTEADFDKHMDFVIQAMNELRDEILAQQEAQQAESTNAAINRIVDEATPADSLIIVPGPRKIKLVPETTLPESF